MAATRDRYGHKWAKKLSVASEPEDEDDEEVDETFLALQKLLKSLSVARSGQAQPPAMPLPPAPASAPASALLAPPSVSASDSALAAERQSREEILATRRQERERFRRYLLSRGTGGGNSGRRRRPAYYCSEDDEEEDAPVQSVESTISNRFMNGSFSRSLNVHVINRDRWSNEEEVVERLPVVMLPKDGKISSPADNPKLKVTMTDEHADLRNQLLANLSAEEEQGKEAAQHYLKPPRSTWFIQSQHLDTLQC